MVVGMDVVPQLSPAFKPWKFRYMDGEVLSRYQDNVQNSKMEIWKEAYKVKSPSTAVLTDAFGASKECPRGRRSRDVPLDFPIVFEPEVKDIEGVWHKSSHGLEK